MRRRIGIIIAWLAATTISVLIATAAVGAVGGRVTDSPSSFAAATTLAAATPTTTSTPGTTTSRPEGPTSTVPPVTNSTTAPPSAATSTTTTAGPQSGQIETFTTSGGTVTLEVTGDEIRLLGATPNSGYTVSEKELSDTKVEIEFRSAEHEVVFHAELHGGELQTSVEGEGDDD